jgi:hypothetical protein
LICFICTPYFFSTFSTFLSKRTFLETILHRTYKWSTTYLLDILGKMRDGTNCTWVLEWEVHCPWGSNEQVKKLKFTGYNSNGICKFIAKGLQRVQQIKMKLKGKNRLQFIFMPNHKNLNHHFWRCRFANCYLFKRTKVNKKIVFPFFMKRSAYTFHHPCTREAFLKPICNYYFFFPTCFTFQMINSGMNFFFWFLKLIR